MSWEVRGSRRTGSRRCRLLSWPLSGALVARRGRDVHCPVRARIAQAAATALLLPSREPGVPTSFGELLAGSFSIAPQPPTSRPQVGGWRLLLTLPFPRPLPLPYHTPTPRRGHATGRSLGSSLPGAAPFSPGAGTGRRAGGGGAPSRCGEPPIGVAGTCAETLQLPPPPPPPREPNRAVRGDSRTQEGTQGLALPVSQSQAAPRRIGPFPLMHRNVGDERLEL